jgi:hypothetical protein
MALRRGLGLFGGLVLGAEFDLSVGQHGADDDENEGRHPDGDHEQIPLSLGDGALGDHGRLRAAQAEGLVQPAAAGEGEQGEPGEKNGGESENVAVFGACAGHV